MRRRRPVRGCNPVAADGHAASAGAPIRRRYPSSGHQGSRTRGHIGTPVCAAARGPVSAAADAASPLDCPRGPLGCQAMFRPPVGLATHSNGRCALPHLAAPQGAHKEGPGAAALRPCHHFPSPLHPLTGALPLAGAPVGTVASPPCQLLGAGRRRRPLGFLRRQGSPSATESGAARPAPVPLRSFLPPWILSQCTAGGLLGVKAKPFAALRVARQLASLDTSPPAVAALRKEGRKTKLQRASRSDGRAPP